MILLFLQELTKFIPKYVHGVKFISPWFIHLFFYFSDIVVLTRTDQFHPKIRSWSEVYFAIVLFIYFSILVILLLLQELTNFIPKYVHGVKFISPFFIHLFFNFSDIVVLTRTDQFHPEMRSWSKVYFAIVLFIYFSILVLLLFSQELTNFIPKYVHGVKFISPLFYSFIFQL